MGSLAEFEGALPAPLPDDYRAFLCDFNGARVLDCPNFDEVVGRTSVECRLFGLHAGPELERLDVVNDNFAELVPKSLLIVAEDPYGNYFGLELVGDRRGAVVFVDHEALADAARSRPVVAATFAALLERMGADVAQREPVTSVADALARRDTEALVSLLTSGCEAQGFVHRAVKTGVVEIVRQVLVHGGDPNERGGIGGSETPLFVAARENCADIVRLLLERGADPNARCSADGTAMEMADPWPRIFEMLARAGAEPTNERHRVAVRRILGR